MTASLAAENGALGHDNKQLAALVREHEQALEQIMDAFRHRAVSYPPFCSLSVAA
jgi:hypothetical protein